MVTVRIRGWVIHFVYESPHKDRSTRICVCVFVWGESISLLTGCRKRGGAKDFMC